MKQKSTTSLKSSSKSLNQSSSLNKTTGSKKKKRMHQSYKDIYLEKKNFDSSQYFQMMQSGSINNSASSHSQRGSINSSSNKFNNSLSIRKSTTISKDENLRRNLERKATVPIPHSKHSSTKKLKSSLNHDAMKINSGFSLEDGTNRRDNEKKKAKFLEVMVPGDDLVKSKGELKIEDLSEIKNDELEAIDTEGNNNYNEKENKEINENKYFLSRSVNEKDLNQIVNQVIIKREQIEKKEINNFSLNSINNNNDNKNITTDKEKQEVLDEKNLGPKELEEDNNDDDINREGDNILIKKKKLSSIKGEEEEDLEENSNTENASPLIKTKNPQTKEDNRLLSLANQTKYNSPDHVNNNDKYNLNSKNIDINSKVNTRYYQSNSSLPCTNMETDFTQRKSTNCLNADTTTNIHSPYYSPMTTSPSNFQIVHESEHSSKSIPKTPKSFSIIKSNLYIKKDKNDNLNTGTQTVNENNHSTYTQTDPNNKFENNLITYTQTEIRARQVSNLSTHTQTELKELGHNPSASTQTELKEESNKCIKEQRENNHNRIFTEPILYKSNKFKFSKEKLKEKRNNIEFEDLELKKKQQKKESNYLESLKKEKEKELQALREKREILSAQKTLRNQNKNQSSEKTNFKIYDKDQSQSLEKRLPELLSECVLTNLLKEKPITKNKKPINLHKESSSLSTKHQITLSESNGKMINVKSILSLREQKIKEKKFYDLNHYNNLKSNLSERLNTKFMNKVELDEKTFNTKYLNKLKEDQLKRETESHIRASVRTKNKSCLPEEKPIMSHFISTNGIMPSNTMKELYEAQYRYLYYLK